MFLLVSIFHNSNSSNGLPDLTVKLSGKIRQCGKMYETLILYPKMSKERSFGDKKRSPEKMEKILFYFNWNSFH